MFLRSHLLQNEQTKKIESAVFVRVECKFPVRKLTQAFMGHCRSFRKLGEVFLMFGKYYRARVCFHVSPLKFGINICMLWSVTLPFVFSKADKADNCPHPIGAAMGQQECPSPGVRPIHTQRLLRRVRSLGLDVRALLDLGL